MKIINKKRLHNVLFVLGVVSLIFIIGIVFISFISFSLRVLIFILIFSIAGFLNARISIRANETLVECVKANIIIILILMVSTRIAYAIAFATVEPFDVLNLFLSFLAYFFVSTIVSLTVYFLEGELHEFL